jgi:hypothetical protein
MKGHLVSATQENLEMYDGFEYPPRRIGIGGRDDVRVLYIQTADYK